MLSLGTNVSVAGTGALNFLNGSPDGGRNHSGLIGSQNDRPFTPKDVPTLMATLCMDLAVGCTCPRFGDYRYTNAGREDFEIRHGGRPRAFIHATQFESSMQPQIGVFQASFHAGEV